MDKKQIHTDIQSIRSLMERSTKFISLSGLSGIMAGLFASIGGMILYYQVGGIPQVEKTSPEQHILYLLFCGIILILSIGCALILSAQKAKRQNQKMWNPASRELLKAMIVPLLSGGILAIILTIQNNFNTITGVFLVFYGLALYAGGQYTFSAVKTLGVLQILLGLFVFANPALAWFGWMIGFGLLHIIYGIFMHFKYERRSK